MTTLDQTYTYTTASSALLASITSHPILVTLRNPQAVPIATITEYLETLFNSEHIPTATRHVNLTQKDSYGVPTETLLEYLPTATSTEDLETLFNSGDTPIATILESTVIQTDSNGVPTETFIEYLPTDTASQSNNLPLGTSTNGLKFADYFPVNEVRYGLSWFLLVIIGVVLSIFIQMVDKNLKLMVPFYALTRLEGATAADSLCMNPGGLVHIPRSARLCFQEQEPLSLLSDLLVILSALLVSLSSETIGIELLGHCKKTDFKGCWLGLTVYNGPSRAAQALLVLMVGVMAFVWWFLRGVRSGVAGNPWSIAVCSSRIDDGTAKSLQLLDLETQRQISNAELLTVLEGKVFALRNYQSREGTFKYGITILDTRASNKGDIAQKAGSRNERALRSNKRTRCYMYFSRAVTEGHVLQAIVLAILCGLLVVILYYKTKKMAPTPPIRSRISRTAKRLVFVFFSLDSV